MNQDNATRAAGSSEPACSPSPSPEFNACMDCVSYIKGACWLHGVKVRGATLGRRCFKAKANESIKRGW